MRHTLNDAERCEKIGEFEIALQYYQLTLAEYEKKVRHVSDRLSTLQNLVSLCHRLGYCMIGLCHLVAGDDSYGRR
jgi:hypothetical protein